MLDQNWYTDFYPPNTFAPTFYTFAPTLAPTNFHPQLH